MKIRPKVFEDAMRFVLPGDNPIRVIILAKGNVNESLFLIKLLGVTLGWMSYTQCIIALQLAACVARDENRK